MQVSKITLGFLVVNGDKWTVKQVNYVRRVNGITQHVKSRTPHFQITRDADGKTVSFSGEASLYHFHANKEAIESEIKASYNPRYAY